MFFPLETPIHVHQLCVKPCLDGLLVGIIGTVNSARVQVAPPPPPPPEWLEALLSHVGSGTQPEVDTAATTLSDDNPSRTSNSEEALNAKSKRSCDT